jgi:hypothetical protein
MDVSPALCISLASIAISLVTIGRAVLDQRARKADVAAETERTFAAIEAAKRDFHQASRALEAFDARARRGT